MRKYLVDPRGGRHFHVSRDCSMTGPHYGEVDVGYIMSQRLNPCVCVHKLLELDQMNFVSRLGLDSETITFERGFVLGLLEAAL